MVESTAISQMASVLFHSSQLIHSSPPSVLAGVIFEKTLQNIILFYFYKKTIPLENIEYLSKIYKAKTTTEHCEGWGVDSQGFISK